MNLPEIRAQYPQYDDLSDDELVTGFHQKFYQDLPFDEFASQVGYKRPETGIIARVRNAFTPKEPSSIEQMPSVDEIGTPQPEPSTVAPASTGPTLGAEISEGSKGGVYRSGAGLLDAFWGLAQSGERKATQGHSASDAVLEATPIVGALTHGIQSAARLLAPKDEAGRVQRFELAKNLEDAADAIQPEIQKESFDTAYQKGHALEWMVVQASAQSPQVATMLASILFPPIAPVTLPTMGLSAGGNQYAENVKAGVPQEKAALDAAINGMIEVASEGVGFKIGTNAGKVFEKVYQSIPESMRAAAASSILARVAATTGTLAGSAALEGTSEAIGQVGQDLSQKYLAGREPGNMGENARTAFFASLLPGAMFAAPHTAMAAAAPRREDPAEVAAPILAATSVDEAIAAAEAALDTPHLDLQVPELASQPADLTASLTAMAPEFASRPGSADLTESLAAVPAEALPESTPAVAQAPQEAPAARDAASLTMKELDLAARLTRSPERRAQLSAEIERRAEPLPAGVPNEGHAAQPVDEPVAAIPAGEVQVAPGPAAQPGAGEAQAGPVESRPQAIAPQAGSAQNASDGTTAQSIAGVSSPVASESLARVTPADAVNPQDVRSEAVSPAEVASPVEPSLDTPKYRDYVAPKTVGSVIKGETRTFRTEKSAAAFAKSQKLQGYTPRQDEGKWVLSKPVRERTAAQKANDARLRERAKNIQPDDDLATLLRKSGGINAAELTRDGADPKDLADSLRFGAARREGGLSLDGAAELMAAHGYDVYDNGAIDATKARGIIQSVLDGEKVYSPQGHELLAAAADARRAADLEPAMEDLAESDLTATDAADSSLVAQAAEIDESRVEALAIQYADDDAGFLAAVKEFVDAYHQNDETAAGRETRAETQAGEGEAAEVLDLATALARVAEAAETIRGRKAEALGDAVAQFEAARIAAEKAGASQAEIIQAMEAPRRPKSPEELATLLERDIEPAKKPEAATETSPEGGVSASEPEALTFEEFAAREGASRQGYGDAGLHRKVGANETAWQRNVRAQAAKDAALGRQRASLADEYKRLVAEGVVREPTRNEHLIQAARGMPEKESTQAARRLLSKRGIAWDPALELKGETESEIRTRETREAKDAEDKRKADNAPSEKDFTLTGSDRQVDVAEAHGQKPMFRRRSGPISSHISVDDAKALWKNLTAGFKNLPPSHFLASSKQAPADLLAQMRKADPGQTIMGAYHEGEIYVFTDNIADLESMERLVARHELRHYGMEGRYGKDLRSALLALRSLNPELKAEAEAKKAEFPDLDDSGAVNEALADKPLDYAKQLKGWKRVVLTLRAWLNARGYKRLAALFDGVEASPDEITRDFLYDIEQYYKGAPPKGTAQFYTTQFGRDSESAPLFARKQSEAWIASGPEALKSAASKIDTYAPGKSLKEKFAELSRNWADRAISEIFDPYVALKKLTRNGYILARMVKSADTSLEATLRFGKPILNDDGSISGTLDEKGFLGHMSELNGEHDRFFMWVAGNRSERLFGEGRENLFSPDEIKAMKNLIRDQGPDDKWKGKGTRPEAYAKAAAALTAYNRAFMDIAEKTGEISAESRKVWEHDFYIPYFRVDEDMTIQGPSRVKGIVRNEILKKLKGGTEPLGDLLDNTIRNWQHVLAASLANQAAKVALKAAVKAGIAVEADEATARHLEKDGKPTAGATYVMDGGERHWYVVNDPFVLEAISSLETPSINWIGMKTMRQFKRVLTTGVTAAPPFRVRNLIRDSSTAIGQNPMSYNLVKNVFEGYKLTNPKSASYAQAMFGGGIIRFGNIDDGKHAEHAKRLIMEGVEDQTILDTPTKVRDAIGKVWDLYQENGDRFENVNRMALIEQRLEAGVSNLEAMFAGRDSMDFTLVGANKAVRFLTQVVPFMNARLQGLYKTGRAVHEDPKRIAYVTGALTLVSIALMLGYKDDDEWKKRADWDRDTYFWFRIGKTAYRIPKGFELGGLASLAERGLEYFLSDEMTGKRFAERLWFFVGNTLSLNPIPQIAKPMVDLYANTDSFTGRQIETRGMGNLSKPERVSGRTSTAAKVLGKAGEITQLSPVQIDHLIQAYFGWLGTHAALTVDLMAEPFLQVPKPSRKIDDVFVVGDFVKSLPSSQSRYIDDFYKQAKTIHEVMGDLKQARETRDANKARQILEERRDELGLKQLYTHAERSLTDINHKIKVIERSELSSEEKRSRIDEMTERKNHLAQLIAQRTRERKAANR